VQAGRARCARRRGEDRSVPAPQRALEGLDREVFGEGVVGGQVHEIGENVVEVLLGDGGEAM
jgi:hypothetical protein